MIAALLGALALLGAGGMAAAWAVEGARRFWANWLLWQVFVLELGLSALFLVAMNRTVHALWDVPLRRVSERVASLIVPGVALSVPTLFFLPVLYPWARSGAARITDGKAAWLNQPSFMLRSALWWAVCLLFLYILVGRSLRQDRTGDPGVTLRLRFWSPVFLVVYAISISLVGFDWVMSLQPRWYSDIFGVYTFAGAFLSALAVVSIAAVRLRDRGRLPGVAWDHLYSFGGLMFAFIVFYGYISFAQYMLIWYANLPKETFWFVQRAYGIADPWAQLAIAIAAVHFFIPFFALLPRGIKGRRVRLLWVCSMLILAHLMDLYWLIFPALWPSPVFSWPELSAALFFVAGGLLWLRGAMGVGADMPVKDPFFEDAMAFRL